MAGQLGRRDQGSLKLELVIDPLGLVVSLPGPVILDEMDQDIIKAGNNWPCGGLGS